MAFLLIPREKSMVVNHKSDTGPDCGHRRANPALIPLGNVDVVKIGEPGH
jgi:hypothetical protein